MHVIIWEFHVKSGCEAEFEALACEWVRLFRTAAGYRGSEIMKDTALGGRYITIDRWDSPLRYHAFRESNAAAYDHIDRVGDMLTQSETLIGEFDCGAAF